MSNKTPEKYKPDKKKYEDKYWLMEQYWGKLRSTREIAEENNVSHWQVCEHLRKFGIPIRPTGYTPDNSVSPFSGFYGDEPTPTGDGAHQQFDPDYDGDGDDNEYMYGWRTDY